MWSRQPERGPGYRYPAEGASRERAPHRRIDWAMGIGLGVVLGIAVIVAFLYFGSEGTIDAPRISGADGAAQAVHRHPSHAAGFRSSEGKQR